jgi:hypothetical protein
VIARARRKRPLAKTPRAKARSEERKKRMESGTQELRKMGPLPKVFADWRGRRFPKARSQGFLEFSVSLILRVLRVSVVKLILIYKQNKIEFHHGDTENTEKKLIRRIFRTFYRKLFLANALKSGKAGFVDLSFHEFLSSRWAFVFSGLASLLFAPLREAFFFID